MLAHQLTSSDLNLRSPTVGAQLDTTLPLLQHVNTEDALTDPYRVNNVITNEYHMQPFSAILHAIRASEIQKEYTKKKKKA